MPIGEKKSFKASLEASLAAAKPESAESAPDYSVGALVEGMVFLPATDPKTGRTEFRSSDPDQKRKIMILSPGQYTEHAQPYDVIIVADTNPSDPKKGKLIVKLADDVPETVTEQMIVKDTVPSPIEFNREKKTVLVLETELPVQEKRGERVPKPERFRHFTLDKRTLETLEKIATAVELHEPCLLEGETSTSKTSSVEYVAMLTGNEVSRLNLNGQTDTSELIGKFVPNDGQLQIAFEELLRQPELLKVDSKKILETASTRGNGLTLLETQKIAEQEGITVAEWRWQDGIIPEAMKKGQWVILDEINLAEPQILERLNSVLERNPSITLSENGGVKIGEGGKFPVHPNFRIFATMNPTEYAGRVPMSPAYKNRWTSYQYVQPPTQADYQAMLEHMVYGEQPKIKLRDTEYQGEKLTSLFTKLESIQGMKELMAKLALFHSGLETMARNKEIGRSRKERYVFTRRDLLQLLEYLESKRITDRKSGQQVTIEDDPKKVFTRAIQYYYLDKISNPEDLKKLTDSLDTIGISEKTWLVKLGKPKEPAIPVKTGIKGTEPAPTVISSESETFLDAASLREAKEIMKEDFYGPAEVAKVWDLVVINPETFTPIPYSAVELREAKRDGYLLIYRFDLSDTGEPLSMKQMSSKILPKLQAKDPSQSAAFRGVDFSKEDFGKEAPRVGWKLVPKDVATDSTGKTFAEQTAWLRDELESAGVLSAADSVYTEASDTILNSLDAMAKSDKWKDAAEKLTKLPLNQKFRSTPVEDAYDVFTVFATTGERIRKDKWNWTNRLHSDGRVVGVGGFAPDGLDVLARIPGSVHDDLGVAVPR